ncbi:MAG: hypothetical protein H8E86_08615 [Planctomycetes bacterium]|nr:hypothetical protein [Planctomycetota bacterium]
MFIIDPPNAAEAWQEYFLEFDSYDFPVILDDDGFEVIYYENDSWSDESHAIRVQLEPLIVKARIIASSEHCDWQLDYSQGLDLPVPHLGRLREVQRMLRYSMQGELNLGNTSAALAEMNAMIGITKHSAESDLLIGSLVAHSSFMLAVNNTAVIDSATEARDIESILASVDGFKEFDPFRVRENISSEKEMMLNWLNKAENPDFSIFQSITGQPVDTSSLDMETEIKRYSFAIGEMGKIFQITDKDKALAAAVQLDKDLQSGEMGFLATALCPSAKKLLEHAFAAEKLVSDFKQILRNKIEMLRNPNSATYFLQAVTAYNAIDTEERKKAISEGEFAIVDEPLRLFTKACSMPATQITFTQTPATPKWVAPLYALSIDCIARGTQEDKATLAAFVGHMSTQTRFASSIIAGKLFAMLAWNEVVDAIQTIPTADAFGLHGSARSARERLIEYFDIDEKWFPSNANVLAMTLTIAKEQGVPDENPAAWQTFIDALGIPDDDTVIEAVLNEWLPESLEDIDLEQEPAFNEMLKELKTYLAKQVRTIRSKGRE